MTVLQPERRLGWIGGAVPGRCPAPATGAPGGVPAAASSPQTLVFDADDTLWENNIRFEAVVAGFLDWLNHPELDRFALRAVLNEVERVNSATHGYGSKVFVRSLHDCFERVSGRPPEARERAEIDALAEELHHHRVFLVPPVAELLADLASRHTLRLLTKGDPAEQRGKLDASGLASLFVSVHIVEEKDEGTYRRLAGDFGLDPATVWMIGNSPRSDINPARRAGWRAVFVPNPNTWALEHDAIDHTDPAVLMCRSLADLRQHF
jgi:putative hydrolase of the HAD superfamily